MKIEDLEIIRVGLADLQLECKSAEAFYQVLHTTISNLESSLSGLRESLKHTEGQTETPTELTNEIQFYLESANIWANALYHGAELSSTQGKKISEDLQNLARRIQYLIQDIKK